MEVEEGAAFFAQPDPDKTQETAGLDLIGRRILGPTEDFSRQKTEGIA